MAHPSRLVHSLLSFFFQGGGGASGEESQEDEDAAVRAAAGGRGGRAERLPEPVARPAARPAAGHGRQVQTRVERPVHAPGLGLRQHAQIPRGQGSRQDRHQGLGRTVPRPAQALALAQVPPPFSQVVHLFFFTTDSRPKVSLIVGSPSTFSRPDLVLPSFP